MALKDAAREFFDKIEHNAARWLLVAVAVIILLRLRLILFAAALPVMAYWHYSNQPEGTPEAADEAGDGADAAADGDLPWPNRDDDDDGFNADNDHGGVDPDINLDRDEGGDPYDSSFWSHEAAGRGANPDTSLQKRNAPWRQPGKKSPPMGPADDGSRPGRLHDDFSLGGMGEASAQGKSLRNPYSWAADRDPGDDDLDRAPGMGGRLGGRGGDMGDLDDFGMLGGGPKRSGGGLGDDFDFLGANDDMDIFGNGGGGRGKGKGKGKGKGEKGPPRDPNAPREANPKQVFVAGVGDLPEDDIRNFFEEAGEVDRLKVLRNPDGTSKGVCFVTFRTEDQAQKALTMHGTSLEGRNVVVRLAHGGNKGGEKGGEKGGGRRESDTAGDGPVDLGGSERFGAAFGFGGDRLDRPERSSGPSSGKSGGRGKGRRNERNDIDDALEEALADVEGPLKPGDFDFAARRFLSELRGKDRQDGTTRFQEALDMVLKYTSSKDRSSVRKWPAYVFTLLQKFDPHLWDELRERDAERRREKGGGGFGGKGRQMDDGLGADMPGFS